MVKSWSAMMSLTMSRMDTMPITRPWSTTGRWRICLSLMSAMHSRAFVRGATWITFLVMISSTRVAFDARLCRITLRV